MKQGVILIGAGGHGRSCIEVIESSKHYCVAGLIGNPAEVGDSVCGYRVIGTDDDLPALVQQNSHALVAIGQIKRSAPRRAAFSLLLSLKYQLPKIFAATATVSGHAQVGIGTIVMHQAIVNAGATVGANTIVNTRALVEHDVEVGDHCHISTGAILNGGAKIGNGTFIGSGAVVLQGVTIGDSCVVGAQSLVVKDLPSGSKLRRES